MTEIWKLRISTGAKEVGIRRFDTDKPELLGLVLSF